MLDPFSRNAILAVPIACVICAIAFAPSGARSSDANGAASSRFTLPAESSRADVELPIARDPFIPAVVPARPVSGPVSGGANVSPVALPRTPIGTLPSNLSANSIPDIPGSENDPTTRVTAIVTGAHPYAMIETAGNHQIKGLGDRVGDKPIVAIAIDGVTLAGGTHIRMASPEAAR